MSQPLTANPPERLIPSGRVAGTAVYDMRGERLGHIDDLMIDKPSGRIAYAVLSFGGFLGFGDKHHPLPWHSLRYDVTKDGYVVDLDRQDLEAAPTYHASAKPDWDDQGWGKVDDYYGSRTRLADEIPLDASLPR